MPIRLRRKRSKSPKVINFSSVLEEMEVVMHPRSYFISLYTKSWVFEGFVKFCQIKANYAKGGMLEWEYERPENKNSFNRSKGDQNVTESFTASVNCDGISCNHSLYTRACAGTDIHLNVSNSNHRPSHFNPN